MPKTPLTGGSTMAGSKVTFHGPVTGSIVNIDSTLTNVRQTIGSLPGADEDQKKELDKLVEELRAELAKVSPDKKAEAETVAKLTEDLIAKAKDQQPRPLVEMVIKNLKEAGSWFVEVMPKVPATIAAITGIIALL